MKDMKEVETKRDNYWPKDRCFDVENIISRKKEGKNNLYLIKWEGYPISECSWEPISNLTNIMPMVDDFDKNFPYSVDQKVLNQFLVESNNKSKKVKLLNKKIMKKKSKIKNRSERISGFNRIIIPLDNSDIDIIIDDKKEEHKTNECYSSNIINNMNDINDVKKVNDNDGLNNSVGKLIKPVLIW